MKKTFFFVFLIIIVILSTNGCREPSAVVRVKKIILDSLEIAGEREITLSINQTVNLQVNKLPYNATDKLIWVSDDQEKVSVKSGTVKAFQATGAGTPVRITVSSEKNPSVSDYIDVIVSDGIIEPPDQNVAVTGVTLQSALALKKGENHKLVPTINPDNAANKNVTWAVTDSSSNVVTVSNDGTVTAAGGGTKTVRVTTVDGNHTADCVVTVTVPVAEVMIQNLGLVVGTSGKPDYTVLPLDAANKNVSWSVVSGQSFISLADDGTVTANAVGEAKVRVTTEDGNKTADCTVTVSATAIAVGSVSVQSNLAMIKGGVHKLVPAINPDNATNKNVTWVVTDGSSDVVTVSNDGTVTAVGGGTKFVKVTTDDGGHTASCEVTVTVPVTDVSLPAAHTMNKGTTAKLTAAFTPADASNKNVTWSVVGGGTSVVSVNTATGLITANGGGTATVRVTTADGNRTDDCVVTVNVPVTGVTLQSVLSLTAGDNFKLEPSILPGDATNKNATWAVTDGSTNIITVSSDGTVTAKAAGKRFVSVTTADGNFTQTCEVTVSAIVFAVTGVTLQPALALKKGENHKLVPTINPDNATNKNVTWAVADGSSNIITVSADGTVTAAGGGTKSVRVTTADGGYTALCVVTVTVPVTDVTLQSSLTLDVGGHAKLVPTVNPGDATNKNVIWTVADGSANIITVSSDGTVNALAAGTKSVRVTTADGGFSTLCQVTVNEPVVPVESVTLSETTITMIVGETEKLSASVHPGAATNKNVSWSVVSGSGFITFSGSGAEVTITGKAIGTAKIRVTSNADAGKYAECTVNVIENPADGMGYVNINVSVKDQGDGLNVSHPNTIIFKTGSPNTTVFTLTNPAAGHTYTWYVNGESKGTGNSFTANAANYNLGYYTIRLVVQEGGRFWSMDGDLSFTVRN